MVVRKTNRILTGRNIFFIEERKNGGVLITTDQEGFNLIIQSIAIICILNQNREDLFFKIYLAGEKNITLKIHNIK